MTTGDTAIETVSSTSAIELKECREPWLVIPALGTKTSITADLKVSGGNNAQGEYLRMAITEWLKLC